MGLWDKVKATFSRGDEDDRLRFLRDAQQIAEHVPGVQSVEPNAEQLLLVLHMDDGGAHEIFLGNMHQELRARSPEERRQAFERFLLDSMAHTAIPDSTWADVRVSLVPVVRPLSTFVHGPKRLDAIRRPFLPFLAEALVIDSAASMRYVNPSELEKWDITADAAFDQARDNLSRAQHGVVAYDVQAAGRAWHVGADDDYQSSRLLLPGWLASFGGKVEGRPIAIIPDRRTLIVGGSDNPALVQRLHALAGEIASASPRFLSTRAYTVDDASRVIPFEASEGSPLAPCVQHGALLLAASEYRAQKEHLEALHEEDGTDIFVASYIAVRDKNGRERCYSSWGEGIDTLLPRTDLIAIGSQASPNAADHWIELVPWSDVMAVAGECLAVDTSLDPVRYRTVGWPDAKAIAELRRRAGL